MMRTAVNRVESEVTPLDTGKSFCGVGAIVESVVVGCGDMVGGLVCVNTGFVVGEIVPEFLGHSVKGTAKQSSSPGHPC